MLTLDEAIAKYKEKAKFFKQTTNIAYGLELEQLAKWLEELKAIKAREPGWMWDEAASQGYQKGYTDAIKSDYKPQIIPPSVADAQGRSYCMICGERVYEHHNYCPECGIQLKERETK